MNAAMAVSVGGDEVASIKTKFQCIALLGEFIFNVQP